MMAFTCVKVNVRDFYHGFHLCHFFRPKRVGGFRGGGLPSIHLEGQDSFILSLSQQLHNHHCIVFNKDFMIIKTNTFNQNLTELTEVTAETAML